MHEDLVASPFIGEEVLKTLRKAYKNGTRLIQKVLSNPEVTKYGSRKPYAEFTQAKPDFLVEVNQKFELKPHQIRGVNSLVYNWCRGRNMILADQAGLGKTIQAITFMSALYHKYLVPGPFLVITPVSNIASW